MFRATITVVIAVLLVSTAGCSQGDSNDAIEEQLAAVTAERDALLNSASQQQERDGGAPLDAASQRQERHDRALATLDEVNAILNDPEAFGSEEEIIDAIARHSTDTAVMEDDVFGAVNYRAAFYATLFEGSVDARLDAYDWWVSEDGSQGGSLWIWYGTNAAGNPFELTGLTLTEFSEDGRIEYDLITYPYSDDYVRRAFHGEGTPTPSTGADQ